MRATMAVPTALAVSALMLVSCGGSSGGGGGADPQSNAADQPAARPKYTAGPLDSTASPQNGGKLVVALEGETDTLDPTRIPLAASGHMVASAVYDPLMTVDDQGKIVPYLATSIDGSNNYQTWVIGLHDGITFHDGTPFNAAAVKANLDAYKASGVSGVGLQFVQSITVTDPSHVTVQVSQPWVNFPQLFLSQVGYMLAPSQLAAPDPATAKPVGTGPFVFESRQKDVFWRFKKNPNYWRAGLPHLSDIEFRPMPDETERLAALRDGTVDLMHTNAPDSVLTLRGSDYKRVEYDNGEKDFIVLNTEKPPFDNLNARKAVAFATDYEKWRSELMRGVKPKATGPLSPGQLGFEEDTGFPTFDLAKAKGYVDAYTKDTGKPLEFEYVARNDPQNLSVAQALLAMWQDAGMKVTLSGYPQIQLIAHVATGGYQLGEWRLFGDIQPDTVSVWLRSTSVVPAPGVSLNFPRFKDTEIDKDVDKALAATDDKGKADANGAIARRLADQVPYIWLGRADWVLAANKRVNGIYPAANGSVQTLGPKTWIADLWVEQ